MAYCPKCRGVMSQTDVICPSCGYDFPDLSAAQNRSPYSSAGSLVLVIAFAICGLGLCCATVLSVMALLSGQWWDGLVRGPIAAVLLLAQMIVFLHVLDRRR